MPNRRLTQGELDLANIMLEHIREQLSALAGGDPDLLFALRRKVAKELVYDERSKPMVRRALKQRMRRLQDGKCRLCEQPLPQRYCVLDRFDAAAGYVQGNVRLICEPCDRRVQYERAFS